MFISDEFREIMEQEQLSVEQIWEIEDAYEFVWEMSSYITEKCDYGSDLDALREEELVFYIAQNFLMEWNNGGLWQFCFNTPEYVFVETPAALEAIGAEKTVALYCEAMAAFGKEMPNGKTSRMVMLGKFGMEEGYALLSPYDEALSTCEEDLDALCYAYVQDHKDAFS